MTDSRKKEVSCEREGETVEEAVPDTLLSALITPRHHDGPAIFAKPFGPFHRGSSKPFSWPSYQGIDSFQVKLFRLYVLEG